MPEWKELSTRTLNSNTYLTDVNNWICGCPAFFINRFFICKHLIQEKGDVTVKFFDEVYRHHQYPFLDTSTSLLQMNNFSQFTLQIPNIDEVIEDEDAEVHDEIYNQLIDVTEKTLEILKDQQMKKNFKWVRGVEKNFKLIEVMLSEITLYKRRRTMPRFKDHSQNTLFFN